MDKQRLQELAGVQLEESKAYFITDFGKSITGTDASGKKKIVIDRFGVWGDTGAGKPQVIDTGDNLEALKKKHGDLKVQVIGKVNEDVQLDEGLTPVNWNNVTSVIAAEFVAMMKKNDSSLFGEKVEYVLNQANEEIMDYVFDKLTEGNIRGKLKQEIEKLKDK